VNQLKRFLKQWMEKESIVAAILCVLSKAFGKILNQEYQVDHSKITLFPVGSIFPDFRQIYPVM